MTSLTYSREKYPEKEDLIAALREFCSNVKPIVATGLAEFADSPASLNVIILGALSNVEGFPIPFKTVVAQIHARFRE